MRKFNDAAAEIRYFFQCSFGIFFTWLGLTFVACLIYVFVIFGSLVDKVIVSSNNVPKSIPYITVPTEYNVTLNFYSKSDVFEDKYNGTVRMNFTARDVTQKLFLNRGNHIDITEAVIEDSHGNNTTLEIGAYDSKTCIQAFLPIANLTNKEFYILAMNFTGKIGEGDEPRTYSYTMSDNSTWHSLVYATSNTENTGLRNLIPCLDSDEYPAFFNIQMNHSKEVTALGNFKSVSTLIDDEFVQSSFPANMTLKPAEVAIALVHLNKEITLRKTLEINMYYRKYIVGQISVERIFQFMNSKSETIGKLDVICLPGGISVQQPGISFSNEHDVVQENLDLGIDG